MILTNKFHVYDIFLKQNKYNLNLNRRFFKRNMFTCTNVKSTTENFEARAIDSALNVLLLSYPQTRIEKQGKIIQNNFFNKR